jgi:hypothetical protein
LVSIDYLSIGMLEDIGETHRTLFRGVSGHGGSVVQGCLRRQFTCNLAQSF